MGFLLTVPENDQIWLIPGACAEGQSRNPHQRGHHYLMLGDANIHFPIRRMVLPPQTIKVLRFCSNFPPYDHTDTYLQVHVPQKLRYPKNHKVG